LQKYIQLILVNPT